MSGATKIVGLFPTPLMLVERFISPTTVQQLSRQALEQSRQTNSGTELLAHTDMQQHLGDPLYTELLRLLEKPLVQFGAALFGDELQWRVKELWLNVLQAGGSQFMHSHANSFISGIIYLTTPHDSARTAFRKPSGGAEFVFKHDLPAGHPNSETWVVPDAQAGSLALYPSYLLHGVPPNEGGQRITLAFNAIPNRLDSLGYQIEFK